MVPPKVRQRRSVATERSEGGSMRRTSERKLPVVDGQDQGGSSQSSGRVAYLILAVVLLPPSLRSVAAENPYRNC